MSNQHLSASQPKTNFAFIALVATLTALVAMSIDTMLPAMGNMARDLGAANPNDEQLILMLFFAGNMAGIPIFGPISDSVGRKPTIFVSLAIYVLGAFICFAASSFPALIAGRIIQGFGAAGPRIVSVAMVRDGAKGAAMARVMSFVMSVFMLVPILAPSIGQLVLIFASWRYLFLGFAIAAVLAGLWLGFGQHETLSAENRQPFSTAKLWASAIEVARNRIAIGYTLATGVIFGVFTTYLATCRRIYVEQYQVGTWFPILFGSLAVCIAIAMILNGNLVHRMGMRKLSRRAMIGYVSVWILILIFCLMFDGKPPLVALLPLFAVWFFAAGFTFGNFNAMAMEPMGHIAGMAAAVSGALSQAIGIVLGIVAGRYYNGTLTPLAGFFVAYSLITFAFIEWAEAGRPAVKPAAA